MSTQSSKNNVWIYIAAFIVIDLVAAGYFLWDAYVDSKKPVAGKTKAVPRKAPGKAAPGKTTPRKAPGKTAPRKATPRKPAVRKTTMRTDKARSVLAALPLRSRLVGVLPSGERVVMTPVGKSVDTSGRTIREFPNGARLFAFDARGNKRALLGGRVVSEVRLSKQGRIAGVTPQMALLLSGPDGKGSTALDRGVDYFPSFDKSGRKLAYSKKKFIDQHTLTLYDVSRQEKRALVKGHSGFTSPVFSPSGRAVVYVTGDSGVASLWKVELDSGNRQQLTNRKKGNLGGLPPDFVPPPVQGRMLWGGRWIVYDSGGTLWAVQQDGKRVKKLATQVTSFRWKTPGQILEIKGRFGLRNLRLPSGV